MRLTAFTDYSLRLLMFLAAQPGRRATIAEVAAAFAISEHHLTKVAHTLGRGGWLANVRGQGPPCTIARVCRLRGVLAQAVDAFYAVLDTCTLADLAANPRALSRLLHIEVVGQRQPARATT